MAASSWKVRRTSKWAANGLEQWLLPDIFTMQQQLAPPKDERGSGRNRGQVATPNRFLYALHFGTCCRNRPLGRFRPLPEILHFLN